MGHYVQSSLMKDETVVCEATLHWIIFVSPAAVLTLFISPLLQMMTLEFAVTNRRVIFKEGLLRRRTIEMNLQKIENVRVTQGILGRLLGYGDIQVVGTGGTGAACHRIRRPTEFRRAVQTLQTAS